MYCFICVYSLLLLFTRIPNIPRERQLDVLLARLEAGDTLIVSELSWMGRSVGEIITTVDTFGKEAEIRRLLALHVSKASIAKITGVDRSTLYHFIRSRRL
jgi:DNA invertase Pin-like site-specific DNA recombinase